MSEFPKCTCLSDGLTQIDVESEQAASLFKYFADHNVPRTDVSAVAWVGAEMPQAPFLHSFRVRLPDQDARRLVDEWKAGASKSQAS